MPPMPDRFWPRRQQMRQKQSVFRLGTKNSAVIEDAIETRLCRMRHKAEFLSFQKDADSPVTDGF